jgi:dihydrofolate reductase
MLDEAKAVAGQKDVYVDGGALIRSALEASLIDEVVVTIIPYILGEGRALFAGSPHAHRLRLLNSRDIGAGMVQLTYQPMR